MLQRMGHSSCGELACGRESGISGPTADGRLTSSGRDRGWKRGGVSWMGWDEMSRRLPGLHFRGLGARL